MRKLTLALVLAVAPGYLAAQGQSAGQSPATAGFSAETRTRLEAMLQVARERNLPTEPLVDLMAEGQAKGAGEAQIIAATQRAEARLVASQQALIRAGRSQPSGEEVARGAQLIASGASSAQLEAFVRRAPAERRLDVALTVLSDLAASGVPVTQAMTSVGVQLGGSSTAGPSGSPLSGSSSAHASSTASVGVGASSLGASGTIGGSVGVGVIRKP